MTQRIEDLTAITVPEEPALSPDGGEILYVLRSEDAEKDRSVRSIWRVGARTGTPRRLTRGDADTSPAWSPDGRQVAFLRKQQDAPQIWLLPMDGGEPTPATALPGGAGAPVWSPDGRRIAFAATVDRAAAADGDAKTKPPIRATRIDYQADGGGFRRGLRRHLFVHDLESGGTRQVTDGDWNAGDPAWSPDGSLLAFAAATAPDADLVYRAPVYVVDAADDRAVPLRVGLAGGSGRSVTWTADGTALLVVGHPGDPAGHAGLWRVPLVGSEPMNLAGPLDRNVMPGGPAYPGGLPQIAGDGRTVVFCLRDRGCTHLYAVEAAGGRPLPVVAGAGISVAGVSVRGGAAAIVRNGPDSYGEIVLVDLATGTQEVRAGEKVEVYPREEREFGISDGTIVAGWLIRDPATEGPSPLLIDVHGGPHNAWNGAADAIHLYHQDLVADGWTVLLINPRGSDGYGEEFFTAVTGAWGTSDAKDFLEPIDALVAEGLADPERLAVTGYSYGGFMTAYLTSRDRRFAAAVAGGMVTDLTSMAGTSDAGHFLRTLEFGGGDLAAHSPLATVGDVRTPTLILHGGADLRCPVGQAQQWHTALREQGVPAELVLYPEGSHLFILAGAVSHRIDWNRRTAEWVSRHAGGAKPRIDTAHWQRRLSALATKHKVPGAALGILHGEQTAEAAHGVLSVATGVGVTTDTLFQIGSITKVWTTTVAMQLVDEGRLDLDAPVAEVLPELVLKDPDAAKQVTMRHLLTHTSGIDGDVFTDTGRGDDCIEKYVYALRDEAQVHPLGATWSYCNSGFTLAGRVIEKLTGGTWDQALKDRLFAPLGLTRTITLAEEALLHRAAVGHLDPETPAPVWQLNRSAGPAGLVSAPVGDVLKFARMHLSDGGGVLSPESTAAMASNQVELPDKHLLGDSWGIGWIREEWDGRRLIGHDGNTLGQSAFLRVLPAEDLAVTLLTNTGNGQDLYEDLFREIFAELVGVALPEPISPPDEPAGFPIAPHAGTYERASTRIEVFEGDKGPRLRMTITGPLAELMPEPVTEHDLVAVEENLFVTKIATSRSWVPVTFYALPTGERYIHFGARATPMVRS